MSSKSEPSVHYCGECMRRFTGPDANEQLRHHVEQEPCPGYAEQQLASTYVLPKPEPSWFPEDDLAPLPFEWVYGGAVIRDNDKRDFVRTTTQDARQEEASTPPKA
jgi:hypothetical protein